MGIAQRSPSDGASRTSRKRRSRAQRQRPRSLRLEPFEERTLFAVGPQLIAAYSSGNTLLDDNQTLNTAPTELRFRFDGEIDPTTLMADGVASIQVTRGGDHVLGNGNDISVDLGAVELETTPTDVVIRFANTLVDDLYQVRIVGSGDDPLRDTDGNPFNDGQDLTRNFTLDLGAQVVAIVPQPITRESDGTLSHGVGDQTLNQIDVYFNANDPLDATTATNRFNYELIRTAPTDDTTPTADTTDDEMFNPTSVTYDADSGKAVLTFASGDLTSPGWYRLRVGNNDPLPFAPVTPAIGAPGSSFDTAADLGTLFPAAQGTQNVNVSGTIGGSPVGVIYPGRIDEPGTRDLPFPLDSHLLGGQDASGVIPTISYNFKNDIGTVLGAPVFNSIDDVQKERVREVFSYYSEFLGVHFVETPLSGWIIATGDPRAVAPGVPPTGVGGIAGGGKAVMNAGIAWGDSGPGGAYFQTAMHEIGHLLGLGHAYELPALTVQGGSEAISDGTPTAERYFPGDADVLLGQFVHPPVGNDVHMYEFRVLRAGTLNLETFAERMRDFDPSRNPSFLNSVITVYDTTGTLVARNDDYYGNDSFLQLELEAGNYFIAVTSTGNSNFDPVIENTGFGGTTQGEYQLRLTFTPASTVGIKDATGTQLDGDADGEPGGVHNFWFRVAEVAETIYVDKAAGASSDPLGSIGNPYKTISLALAAASSGSVVRIVGNSGADGFLATVDDNLSYNIGRDNIGRILSDGAKFEIPRGVTVMIDASAIIKLRGANIDAGTVVQGIDHAGGALQVLGTTARDDLGRDIGSVYITSYYNDLIGTDANTAKDPVGAGDWGGLVFHADSDLESDGVFLNYVNQARISYGGGRVVVFSVDQTFDPIHIVTARPTISFNTITDSANAAVSADPNAFEESQFQGPAFAADYTRSGPRIHGNSLLNNSIKGLFLRVRTPVGDELLPLTVSARFSTTDMVYVIQENLQINGQPGGYFTDADGRLTARPGARLAIDPGVIVKLGGARIATRIGGQLIAEGSEAEPIIFTSIFDDRYGAGGAFDTTNDGANRAADEGDWGGLFFGPLSIGSLDHVLVTFAGGETTIEGGFAAFNAIEIHRAQVRVTNSTIERNAAGGDTTDRAGRSPTTPAIIFVRGAQPVLVDNIIQNNDTKPPENINTPLRKTAAISINVNSLTAKWVTDWGRSTGRADLRAASLTNSGPLVDGNRIGNTPINGMVVRGGRLTTDVVMDDADIVHVVFDEIMADTQFSLGGRVRLQSSSSESLVVKLLGTHAGFTAAGVPLDIDDRKGGSVQIVGMPNHPVIMTSLFDTSVGAGFRPDGNAQNDTHNIGGSSNPEPPPSTSGPIFIDGGDRDDHGSFSDGENRDGWKFIEQAVDFAYTESFNTDVTGILAIGIQEDDELEAQDAIESVVDALGFNVDEDLTYVTGNEIDDVDFAEFRMIYVPSNGFNTQGGISEDDLDRLADRKLDIQKFINITGGGLVALTEGFSANPYAWLELPQPFTIQPGGGVDLVQTPLLAAAGFNITDEELTNGTPWHNSFVGPPGFNRLQVWVVDPADGRIVTLGAGAGQGGIGLRLTDPLPGDWRSIKLDDFSNDRNVDLVNETEQRFAPTGDTNGVPTTAQFLGELAADLKSGDDIRRLGYEIHGSISQTTAGPNGGDVDVYSFRGKAGSIVWFDIDRTAQGLDTIVELIDGNGAVVARSDDSFAEQALPSLLAGIAQPMQAGFDGSAGPFTNPDFYSTNPMDAGMRLILPGAEGTTNTYFVRVRAASDSLGSLTAGLSQGEYVLQVRLQNEDEFPGSIVRNADIRFAGVGVEVIGKPAHSPLLGDTASSSIPHDTFETAQYIGNLLTTDRNEITVAGNLSGPDDVLWFKMDLNYDLIQSIGGFSNGMKSFATMFNIEYADGLVRPDTTISVFDANGNLVLIGRDSGEVDAQPRPTLGADTANLNHGSFGAFDATVGSAQLPAGGPQPSGVTPEFGGTGGVSYYIAVSTAAVTPTILDASFQLEATDPFVRLEPINSVARVVDDRIGATGDSTASGSEQVFGGTAPIDLNVSAVPFTLADVVLYVNTFSDELFTVNPFTGQMTTFITSPLRAGEFLADACTTCELTYGDIAMRDDGRMYTFRQGFGGNNTAIDNGTYTQFDPGTAATMDNLGGPLETFTIDPANPITPATAGAPAIFAFVATQDDPGVRINAMEFSNRGFFTSSVDGRMLFVVGNRAPGTRVGVDDTGTIPEDPEDPVGDVVAVEFITQTQNLLFRLNPNTGAPLAQDFYANEDFFPPRGDNTHTSYFAYLDSGKMAGPGTNVVPRGTLDTGVFLAGVPGSAVSDGDTFSIYSSTGTVRLHLTTFEFDTDNDIEPGNFRIPFNSSDSTLELSTKIATIIDLAGPAVPFANPVYSAPVSATVQGDNVKISGSRFADVSPSLDSDGFNFFGAGEIGWLASSADVTGIAFLQETVTSTDGFFFFDNLPRMYAVSENGGLYEVIGKDDFDFGFDFGYTRDDNATLKLLSIVDSPDGGRARFSGLTQGPANVEGGRYANTLFATDETGNLYAFDSEGNPSPIFYDGRSVVDMGFWGFGVQGLAFSSLDYNLWHTTDTRKDDEGHGLTRSFDFDVARNPVNGDRPPRNDNSFYFALEDPDFLPAPYQQQPGAFRYESRRQTPQSQLLSGNESLYTSYNLPGGAYGSLVSDSFSLEPYSPFERPTLYFTYLSDTDANEDATGGLDGIRVYASTDEVNWVQLATNAHDDLSPDLSASSTLSELFDPAGQESDDPRLYDRNDFDQTLPTIARAEDLADDGVLVPIWRQARIDLADFAGEPSVVLRFDFTTAGSMGIGDSLQGGVYLGAVAGRKLSDGDSFTVDLTDINPGKTFTFRQGWTLVAPGGGSVIPNGEWFRIDGVTFEFTRPGVPLTVGDFAVLIDDGLTATEVADRIVQAISSSSLSGVTPVRDAGFSLMVPPTGGATTVNGETITINGTTFELRTSDEFSGDNIAVPVNGRLTLQVPASGAGLANGETFTINGQTFELRSSGIVTPGNILISYTNGMPAQTITSLIDSAITGAGIGVTTTSFSRDAFSDTLRLNGATSAVRSTIRTTILRTRSDDITWTPQRIADTLSAAIVDAGIGVTPIPSGLAGLAGANMQLAGAGSLSQSTIHSLLAAVDLTGQRVQLLGASTLTQRLSPSPTLGVEGSAAPSSPGTMDILYQINWTAEQVAQAIAVALDATLTADGNSDDSQMFTSSKVNGAVLRVWGHTVDNADPLAYADSLPGQTNPFFSVVNQDNGAISDTDAARARGLSNNHEGLFIDDIVVGLAGRGEMVTGNFNPVQQLFDNADAEVLEITGTNTFTVLPPGTIPTATVTTGPFQLNIRRGTEYAVSVGGAIPFIRLLETRDINDRLAQGFTLVVPPISDLQDGLTFAITIVDGRTFTFEFDFDEPGLVSAGNFRVPIRGADSREAVALRIRDAINGAAVSEEFDVQASSKSNSARVDLFGGIEVDPGPLGLIVFDNLGDVTPTRTQGYTIVQGNRISDSQQAGVIVRPGVGEIDETSFSIGEPGHTYSVINLPAINVKELVPGVAIKENLIIAGGQTGIVFSGSPNTDVAHAAPFGRIINNTVVDTPSGIQIINNASPTLLNNIIADTETAIRVDNSSRSTVIGTTVYKDNEDDLLGDIQTNAIFLASGAPLFVDTSKRNYYLLGGSEAIDSSLNSLPERADMQAVLSPLGISPSPIKASEFDLLGQLRVDDPTVQSPPGLGSNVFKDRGAVERADVKGPVATLVDPIDNDAALLDRDQAVHDVILVGQKLAQFTIQLGDGGLGVDDSTVLASQFVIERTLNGITTTLTPDVDYTIGIENTDDIVLVTPAEGVWINGTYTITIDNSGEGIRDLAGNNLQPNRQSGLTQFTIELTDTPVSTWQNPDNPLDVNADGFVSGLDALLIINRLLLGLAGPLPAIPIVPPFIDTTGDGSLSPRDALLVINFLSRPPAAPATAETVVPLAEPLASEPAVSPATSSAPSSNSATSAIAFGVTVGSSSPESSSFASASIDVTSTNWPEPASGSTSLVAPAGAEQAAAADDVWGSDEWDASTDEWDGIVSELFDESEEQNSVVV